jgi:hypothetical protein
MFEEYHEIFSNEVYQATACYVFWNRLQNEPAEDKELLKAFNASPLSWITIRHSMMHSLIMTLGRIFDIDSESVSVDNLISSCISEVEIFSKESLKERKLKQAGFDNDWIDDYIEKAYEPTRKDFHMLKPEITKYKKIYQEYYRPLRNKVFAHIDKEYTGDTSELWEATKNANMVDMLNFLEDLKVTLQMAYDNGRKPELGGHEINEEWFSKDILSLFSRVKNA